MQEGWFNAFRDDFSPIRYGESSSPTLDMSAFTISAIFIASYIAFLLILPGVRQYQLASAVTVTITFLVGSFMLGAIIFPSWNIGSARIISQFRAHSIERVEAYVGAKVGLYSLNLTMNYLSSVDLHEKRLDGINFNEKFDISSVGSMTAELQAAYRKGLPYPMLKLLEYFSLNQGAFDWGRNYRLAGHFTGAALWTGLGLWLFQLFFLALVPHHYGKLAVASGTFSLTASAVYIALCPRQLKIFFTGVNGVMTALEMRYGACFYLTLVAGTLNITFGGLLCVLQYMHVYTLKTFVAASADSDVRPSCANIASNNEGIVLSTECTSSLVKKMVELPSNELNSLRPQFNACRASSGFQSCSSNSFRSPYSSSSVLHDVTLTSSQLTIDVTSEDSEATVDRL